jgi:Lrp/AsnC family leucine-responsive transcriptional regulator
MSVLGEETLDQFDWKILRLVQEDSRRKGEALSAEVGLSAAACLRRLQRLRKIGAIAREVAVLSPDLEAERTQIIVLLTITRNNAKRVAELTERLLKVEMVERAFSITGDNDVALIMRVPTMQDFSDFAETYLYDEPVKGFESLVVLKEYRRG